MAVCSSFVFSASIYEHDDLEGAATGGKFFNHLYDYFSLYKMLYADAS